MRAWGERNSARRYLLLTLAAFSFASQACTDAVTPARVIIAQGYGDSVFIGRSYTIALLSAEDSAVVTAAPATWTSSDTTVAVVDAAGGVFGMSAGRATISAELDGGRVRTSVRAVPFHADGGLRFIEGAVSAAETCAIEAHGVVYCASTTALDTLGMFTVADGATSLAVTQFRSTRYHRCVLSSTGKLYCSGNNGLGQLGLGRTTPPIVAALTESVPAPRFSSIDVGGAFSGDGATCGIGYADSLVYCAGGGNIAHDSTFRAVDPGLKAVGLGLGRGHACLLAVDRSPWCWGQDVRGAIGAAVTTTLVPQHIPGGDRFVAITSGSHSCGITEQHELKCWGSNQNGQLGLGAADMDVHDTPQRVNLPDDVRFALAGNSFTCAVTAPGALYCWGRELPISLGLQARLGTRLDAPLPFAASERFVSITIDAKRICGVTFDHGVICL